MSNIIISNLIKFKFQRANFLLFHFNITHCIPKAQYPMLLLFVTITITFTLTQATQAGRSANLSGAGCLVKVTHYSNGNEIK